MKNVDSVALAVTFTPAADVEMVEVGTNRNLPNALIHHHPKDNLQAKFSMEFCLAILLIEGKAGLGEFTEFAATQALQNRGGAGAVAPGGKPAADIAAA